MSVESTLAQAEALSLGAFVIHVIRVYVEWSIERIFLFDDRERTSGGLRARFDKENPPAKRQAFSSRGSAPLWPRTD